MKTNNKRLIVPIVFLAASLACGCSTARQVKSNWRDREIIIDGQDSEWSNKTVLYDKEHHLTMAMANDRESLYLRLSTPDHRTQQTILRLGLTVWLDGAGGKNKTFGIHYPLAQEDMAMPPRGGQREPRPTEGPPPMLLNCPDKVEILLSAQDKGTPLLQRDLERMDLQLKMGMERNILVYEMKIPLHPGELPLPGGGLTLADGQRTGIGLESGRMETDKMGPPMGGPGTMGHPPEGRGHRGPPPQMEGRDKPKMPEPIEIWAVAKLVTQTDQGRIQQ